MPPLPVGLLHIGPQPDLGLFDYLYRVLLHLVAFGGLGLLVRWTLGAARSSRKPVEPGDPPRR